jgi:hypothetical protein
VLGQRARDSMPGNWTPDVLGLDHRVPKLHIFQAKKASGFSQAEKSTLTLRSVLHWTQGCCILLGCGHIKSEEGPLHRDYHSNSANFI